MAYCNPWNSAHIGPTAPFHKPSAACNLSRGARAVLVLALMATALRAPAETKSSATIPEIAPAAALPAAPAAPVPANLQVANAKLAQAQTPAEYAATLEAFSSVLPPSDSLSFLKAGLASSDALAPTSAETRSPLLVKAGDLALLLGLFGDAASSYLEAASFGAAQAADDGRPRIPPAAEALLLRAARCELAAGDAEKALDIAARLIAGSDDPILAASSRLVGAWAHALQGHSAEATTLAVALTRLPLPPELVREARFIIWLCEPADERAKAAATLAADFPGSPEALIASGDATTPPLPHWYLGGLLDMAAPGTTAAPTGGAAAIPTVASGSPTAIRQTAPPAPVASSGKRLQVGYFSVEENARALKDELASKGFAATIEARARATGAGKAEERRWIVTVDAKDMAKTRQSLKDAGYEAYVID